MIFCGYRSQPPCSPSSSPRSALEGLRVSLKENFSFKKSPPPSLKIQEFEELIYDMILVVNRIHPPYSIWRCSIKSHDFCGVFFICKGGGCGGADWTDKAPLFSVVLLKRNHNTKFQHKSIHKCGPSWVPLIQSHKIPYLLFIKSYPICCNNIHIWLAES